MVACNVERASFIEVTYVVALSSMSAFPSAGAVALAAGPRP
jgi:hypothetical protein